MKNLLTLLFIANSAMAIAHAGTPVETLVPVDHIYSPKGFDSNDNSEVVISGYLPNLCHKSPSTEVKVIGNQIEITVKALFYEPNNPFCPEVIVPFIQAVNVGLLDKGLYQIRVNGQTPYEQNSQLTVAEATSSSVDDYVYANVDWIDKGAGGRTVYLKGYNPSDCFVFDRIEITDNGKDTYSIQPKMKQVTDFCPMKMVPFALEMEVPAALTSKKVLLHVRSMNGNSVNSLFPNY
jgi:hypothetical protein